jgi:hypothetical protein
MIKGMAEYRLGGGYEIRAITQLECWNAYKDAKVFGLLDETVVEFVSEWVWGLNRREVTRATRLPNQAALTHPEPHTKSGDLALTVPHGRGTSELLLHTELSIV